MLGQLAARQRAVLADLEAGVGTLTRLAEGSLDLVLLVTEPSPKAIEVARRAAEIVVERGIGRPLVVANKVRGAADVARIQAVLGEVTAMVPEDPAVLRADRDGLSPFDAAPDAPAVRALVDLAAHLREAGP